MSRGRILFLHSNDAPFVRADREILRTEFDVSELDCSKGSYMPRILKDLRRSDLSFSWFALGHAARATFLGKLLARPSVVVAGGWDVVSMPEIAYGAVQSARGTARAKFVLRTADVLLTFSDWSRERIRSLSRREATLLYLGIDAERFRPIEPKEDFVVSVGNITRENLARKGMETFVRAATFLPRISFVLAGAHVDDAIDSLRRIATPNVSFPGRLSDDALRDLLGRARAYVQTSYTEGFGLAVAEAMAAGCVPVVTRNGAIPEVVGETGVFVPYGDPRVTADAIGQALGSRLGAAARDRVRNRFSLAQRSERLLAIVSNALDS